MQRKNNFLKSSKSGMAMIMAIAVIVIISTILALALSLSTQTSKSTVNIYLYEQSNLLARSALEYAKLKVGLENNSTNRCGYTGEGPFTEAGFYNISINVDYIYNSATATCGTVDLTQDTDFGAALIDVVIEVNDPSVTSEPIRIFKRKLVEI